LKENKPNILFLASWYPNAESSQAGNFIQQHAYAVSEYVNVAVIHVVAVKNQQKHRITKGWRNGIYEVIVYYEKTASSFPIFSQYQKAKNQRAAYITAYNIALKEFGTFNLTHLNVVYPAGLFALYLKNKFNIPFILTEHWTAFQDSSTNSFTLIEKYFIKKIARQAEFICPVSKNLKSHILKFGIKNNFKVIPNVVNTTIFKVGQNSKKTEKLKLLHVSNLKDDHKNITGILNVVKRLSEQRNDFLLTIAGNGNIEKYKQDATNLNISKEVLCFDGEKSPKEIAQLMNESDVFLLFSNYETFSVVIAESWVCGLPVIASKCGGLTEDITSNNGIQVRVKDEDSLLQAIVYMINNVSCYDKLKIANEARDTYSQKTIGKQYYNIYQKIIGN
jgi:glycosyltransferase involved in cell wall biosynthesis